MPVLTSILTCRMQSAVRTSIVFLLAGVLSISVFALGLAFENLLTPRRVAVGMGAAVLGAVAMWLGIVRLTLIFGWVMSLIYSRAYFLPDPRNLHGYKGLYFIAADGFLLALYVIWIYELLILKMRIPIQTPKLWYVFLPFGIACALSVPDALHPEWAAFELTRIAKAGLILLYLRYNLGPRELVACVAGVGAAVTLQLPISIGQVAFRKFGAIQLLGETWTRGFGTLIHPNILASYLLLVSVPFHAILLSGQAGKFFLPIAAISVSSAAAMALTMSRTAWLLYVAQLLFLMVVLVGFRFLRLTRAIALVSLGITLCGVTALPVAEKLVKRFSGNFQESIDFRRRFNEAAMKIFWLNPSHGVGLNNFELYLRDYAPEYVEALDDLEKQSDKKTRLSITVHNLYMFILSETGVFGEAGLLWIILCAAAKGIRRIAENRGIWRVGALAMTIGLTGVFLQETTEPTLWVDATMFTFLIIVVAINNLSVIARKVETPELEAA